MTHAVPVTYFLEKLNGAWFVLGVAIIFIFAAYLNEHRRYGYSDTNRAALSILIYFVGETLMRGWVWQWRLNGGDPYVFDYGVFLLLGSAMTLWGAFCCVLSFRPSWWSRSGIFTMTLIGFGIVYVLFVL